METIESSLRILGLSGDATAEDINQSYRDLAKVWHPDRFPNDARLRRKGEETFKKINEAYELLQHCAATSGARRSAATNRSQASEQFDENEVEYRNASKTGYTVVLQGFGQRKIGVIKAVREATGLGLSEAKDLVEGVLTTVMGGLSKSDAEKLKRALEEVGATVSINGPIGDDFEELRTRVNEFKARYYKHFNFGSQAAEGHRTESEWNGRAKRDESQTCESQQSGHDTSGLMRVIGAIGLVALIAYFGGVFIGLLADLRICLSGGEQPEALENAVVNAIVRGLILSATALGIHWLWRKCNRE